MNRGNVAAILGGVGLSVEETPVSTEALSLPDSTRARKLVDFDGYFSVYCIESAATAFPFAELSRALERSGADTLALVLRDGKDTVALHAAAGAPTVRADLSDPEVETLLSNLAAWPESDALTVSENIHRLVEQPRGEERAYQNRGLFSDHYLEHRLTDARQNPEWTEDVNDAYQEFLSLYEEKKDILDGLNETQTEPEFLEPALRILGFTFIKQTKTEMGNRPDFALFVDEATKNAAFADQKDPQKFYASSLSILEGKYWGRELDQTRKSDPKDLIAYKSSPEMQVVGYLQATGLSWGVLTNGMQWRLYHGDALGKTTRYYSVDLVRVLESEEKFRRFYLFFRREAFIEKGADGQTFLDRVLSGSEAYGLRVGEELKRVVFEDLFPGLAEGFLAYHERRRRLPVDEDTLDKAYCGTFALLYRLLFLLYAEARDLLPAGDRLGYYDRSITRIKTEVAEKVDKGQIFSSNSYDIWGDLKDLFGIVDGGDPDSRVPLTMVDSSRMQVATSY